MDQNINNDQNSIKNIVSIAPKHCENCGHKYSESDFHLMKSSSINTLFHLKCSNCGNTYMLNIVSPMQGMVGASRIPLNLDLNSVEEITKFAGHKPTEADEAIDIFDDMSKSKFSKFWTKIKKDLDENKFKKDPFD